MDQMSKNQSHLLMLSVNLPMRSLKTRLDMRLQPVSRASTRINGRAIGPKTPAWVFNRFVPFRRRHEAHDLHAASYRKDLNSKGGCLAERELRK
jgi:hypothetical protein